ncbi:GNAT family N-acetyltransferase [Streptomyces boncukensis]|uniref:GNAT family N-acetyltransferase n=1 Tax=Streptomyces boncukensis TaxID=2711219 RepID=A0A6G4WVP2_9ACTN|nr:GNAT family N-acetyltransferase [Streptomyces boncukensis]NGO68677.1 GNAT family N-acetyltransferase [Streptomyces boncukensis]
MTTDLRQVHPSEWDSWYGKLLSAFAEPETPEERAVSRDLTELDRTLGLWEDGDPVATAGLFSFRMTVPGGAAVPTAGVTMVSVAPTHRRRGVLRSMMRRQLDDVRAAGAEPLAALTASEPAIYSRFGYGLATRELLADIDTSRVALTVPEGADAVRLRLVEDPASVLDVCESVYARVVPTRPGMLARRPGWEHRMVLDPERKREGAAPLRCVLAERDGETVGYARYAVKPGWSDREVPRGAVLLRDLEALDEAAYGALWRFLFDIDLAPSLRLDGRPVDDPWQHMVSDIRRCGMFTNDGLFLRPVDVGAALAARTYAAPVDVVFGVEDGFCAWNTGRWRLSGDPKGAVCERTRDPADLTLSVRELGEVYLGGTSLSALARAGRVREERPERGALREAAVAFLSETAPWLPHGF